MILKEMNQRMLLENTIEKLLTEENPLFMELGDDPISWKIFQESGNTLDLRPAFDVITAVCWTTDTNCRRRIAYMQLSKPGGYRRSLSFTDGQMVDMHAHSHIELTYIVRGQVKIKVNDKDRTLQEGELLLINSRTSHAEYLEAKEASLLCLDLDDAFFDLEEDASAGTNSMKNIRELINRKRNEYSCILFTPVLNEKKTEEINKEQVEGRNAGQTTGWIDHYFNEILTEFSCPGAGRKRMLLGMAERIADLLPREFHMQVERNDTKDYQRAIISDIKDYIYSKYSTVTVEQIGETFHYSTDYLNRLLKKEGQPALSQLILKSRMEAAMQLILTSDHTIEEIAGIVGYHNLGFFYTKFRQQYGQMPGKIRKAAWDTSQA